MVLLNIPTFDFSPLKYFLGFWSLKIFNPYFLVNSCQIFIFFNEIFQKWIENYDNIFQKKLDYFTKHEFNMNFVTLKT